MITEVTAIVKIKYFIDNKNINPSEIMGDLLENIKNLDYESAEVSKLVVKSDITDADIEDKEIKILERTA